jgi:DNA-directed RNA polymerase II subunit RPB1
VKEIIHAVQNPKAPTMNVYLDSDISIDPDKVLEMKMNIQGTKIKDVIISDETTVFYERDTLIPPFKTQFTEDKPWVRLFYTVMFNGAIDPSILSHYVIRLVLDQNKLQKRGLTVNSIANHLNQLLGEEMLILNSDVNYSKAVIRMRLIYDKPPTNDDDRNIEAKFLKQYLRQHLKEFVLCGAPNIENSFIESNNRRTYNSETNEIEANHEWYLLTEGTDLKKILNWTGVDHTRTISNNPSEILEVLGIEATRQSIIFEIERVMKFYGIQVNYRNLSLLADTMTGRGGIMAINRHGINRTDASPLKKCTFEETVDMLLDAGKDAVYDDLNAVSSNIIVGKLARLGTGMFGLKWDNEANRKYSTPRSAISRYKKIQHEQRKERRRTSAVSPARENYFEDPGAITLPANTEMADAFANFNVKDVDTSNLFGDIF